MSKMYTKSPRSPRHSKKLSDSVMEKIKSQ